MRVKERSSQLMACVALMLSPPSLAFCAVERPSKTPISRPWWGTQSQRSKSQKSKLAFRKGAKDEASAPDTNVRNDVAPRRQPSSNEIVVSASMEMPFSSQVAFDAFSDLPRQATFSPWLESVEYLTPPKEGIDRIGKNLGETKWTMKFMGLRFSWNAISTRLERPNVIEWESTSGMKNFGRVDFVPLDGGDRTHMKMSMTFVAPRLVASLFRRSNKMASFVQAKMLVATLKNFRDTVIEVDLTDNEH